MSKEIVIDIHKDKRGILIPINFSQLPFQPQRTMIISGVQNAVRGKHAHHNNKQFLMCLDGIIQLRFTRNGKDWMVKYLHPGEGFYHREKEWLEMFFQKTGTLISYCSEEHNENDYIKDFEAFKKLVND